MSWGHTALSLSPDAAVVLLTLGLLLVVVEINRPGVVVPGAVGLTLTLVAAGSLFRTGLGATGLVLVLTAAALLLLDLFRSTAPIVAAAATLSLVLGLYRLVPAPSSAPGFTNVHAAVAVVCGLVLGVGTSVLTRIARRARANKAVD